MSRDKLIILKQVIKQKWYHIINYGTCLYYFANYYKSSDQLLYLLIRIWLIFTDNVLL